jgi:putative N6-adenine-specific DNA methylase
MVPESEINLNFKISVLEKLQITVKTLEGLEEALAQEIKEIGGVNIVIGKRVVYFDGDLPMVYRANYRLRTALRVFRQIESFRFSDADDFYIKCIKVKWETFMNLNQTFAVQSTVFHSELFKNSMFASLKVKDAIVDRFRQRSGNRPDVDTKSPEIIFHVHINNNQCTLSIDSSGESLHKRGYRQVQGDAPLSEVLAAGMILISGWDGSTDFIDPMCGSGTLPIEAALIARNIPPGKYRKDFAFMEWKDYNEELFEKIKEEVELKDFSGKIYASDIMKGNLIGAQTNARSARVFNLIQFQSSDFAKLEIENVKGTMIINPPYGERLSSNELENLYQMIGEKLKHQFTGNKAWIISSTPTLLNAIGLKPSRKHKLLNGALVCSYQQYDLFSGKRKDLIKKSSNK